MFDLHGGDMFGEAVKGDARKATAAITAGAAANDNELETTNAA